MRFLKKITDPIFKTTKKEAKVLVEKLEISAEDVKDMLVDETDDCGDIIDIKDCRDIKYYATAYDNVSKFLPYIGERAMFIWTVEYENLFSDDEEYSSHPYIKNVSPHHIFLEIGIRHLRYSIRNSSFNIKGYALSTLKGFFQRMYNGYDINIFYNFHSENFMAENIIVADILIQERID